MQVFKITTAAQGDAYFEYTERMGQSNWTEIEWDQKPEGDAFATLSGSHISEEYFEVDGKTVLIDHVTGTVYAFEHTPAEQLARLEAICK